MDRKFLSELEKYQNKEEILELVNDIDDDDISFKMEDAYKQILEVNLEENVKNIIKIIDYKYRELFK